MAGNARIKLECYSRACNLYIHCLLLFIVKCVHGLRGACNHKAFDHFEGQGDFLGKYFLFIAAEPAKHVVDLKPAGKVAAYANPQPREIVSAKHFDDVVQAVVAAPAAFGFHPQHTGVKIQVVDHHQCILNRDILLGDPVPVSFAAQVHVGGWLDHDHGSAAKPEFGPGGITVGGKLNAGIGSQGIADDKPDVVPGIGIFFTDVSEAGNEVLHNTTE